MKNLMSSVDALDDGISEYTFIYAVKERISEIGGTLGIEVVDELIKVLKVKEQTTADQDIKTTISNAVYELEFLRWEINIMIKERLSFEEIRQKYAERAIDLINKIGLTSILTEEEVKLSRESKFELYLALFGGENDEETRRKIFAMMDEGVLTSFILSQPLIVETDFLEELGYQAYLRQYEEEDTYECRREMFEIGREYGSPMTFVEYVFEDL